MDYFFGYSGLELKTDWKLKVQQGLIINIHIMV